MQQPFLEKCFFYLFPVLSGCILFLATACQSGNKQENRQEVPDSTFHSRRLSALTDSIRRFPDSSRFYFERGALLFVTKDFNNAKKDLRKALDLDPFISAYATALGQLYFSQHFPDSAMYYFRQAVHIDSANRRARLQLALVLLQQERYRETLKQTDTLLSQDSQLTAALGLQSQAFQALGDTVQALRVMEKVVSIPPVSYDALMRMGDLLLNRGDKEALTFYKRAAEKDSAAGEPFYCIGLYYERKGLSRQAIAFYNQAIVREVDFALAYKRLGQLYEKAGNWEKAKEIFNLAIKTNPTNAAAYYHRGLANERLNHIQAAIADYKQALVFDENYKKAKSALNRIERSPL